MTLSQKYSAVVFLCLCGNFVLANSMAATLSGTISDEDEPVVMAEVMIVDAANNTLISSKLSDKTGRYQFELPNGVYNLNVSKTSFASVWIKKIVLHNDNVIKNVTLTPEAFVDDQLVSDPDGCN